MLNVLRRSANNILVKILLGLLTLSFVVWGVDNFTNVKPQAPIVEASGWNIGPQEFTAAYENEFQRLRERYGPTLDKKTAELLGLKMRTLNSLISRHLLLSAAADLRLTVSPDALRRMINENPAFQENGRFSKDRYEIILRNNRLSPREFENQLISDIIIEQLRRTAGTPVAIPAPLVEDIFAMENEQRIAQTLVLQPKSLEETIPANDEDLTGHMRKTPQNYMTPVKVKLRYAVLNADSVRDQVKVTDEEIKEFYNDHLKEYQKPETRQARHILAKIDDKQDAEAATTKIQRAQERLKKGESFAEVAKALSDDATASLGGDLGEFGKGVMAAPFETAAFALEAGKVSEPVTTEFGVHLLLVEKINPATTTPLEKATLEIRGRIVETKAKDLVYERSVTLEDQLFASGNLAAIAKDMNLRYKESDWISRDSADRSGVELDEKFLSAAFATQKGSLSPLTETANNQFVAMEVVDRQDPVPMTLEQARKELLRDYRQERAKEEAHKIMKEVVKKLDEGQPAESLTAMHPQLRLTTTSPFTRESQDKELGPVTRDVAFKLRMERPNHAEVIDDGNRLVALRLIKIIEAKPEDFKKAEPELRKRLEESLGQEQLTAYLNGLWGKANIRMHQEVLDRL
ncbi:MAG: SurA N-terminal domain-containing protein [Magnetococcales bacterium]|nr:SurA N-terminal domain-containing protein [Magnetococcales bacterium]